MSQHLLHDSVVDFKTTFVFNEKNNPIADSFDIIMFEKTAGVSKNVFNQSARL